MITKTKIVVKIKTNNTDHLVKMYRMYRKCIECTENRVLHETRRRMSQNCLFVPVFSSLKARMWIKWWFTKHTVKCSVNVGYYQYVQCILLIVEICKARFSKFAVTAEKNKIYQIIINSGHFWGPFFFYVINFCGG